MKWNVFSLEAVKTALEPKFVLEKVRYVTDDEEYGEGESTRLVFRNVEEMPEIDHIERTISTFIRDTYVHFKDKNIKPMRLWQDNLNESEEHIRYSTNHLVSPSLELIGETYISDESYTHKWLVAQGGIELLERAFGIFITDEIPWDTLEELVRKDSGNRPSFLYNDNFISFWEIVWNLSEDTDESCLPYVESITATGGIFTDENGNKDVFMGCINGCSATLTQCEYTCGRYCTCDAVAVANDLLRDNELKS